MKRSNTNSNLSLSNPLPVRISSKADFQAFLAADLARRGLTELPFLYQIRKPIIHYTVLLRKTELLKNTSKGFIGKLRWKITALRLKRYGAKLGFSVCPNTCGPGLYLVHWGSIVISSKAAIGKNCTIHSCVNVGASDSGAPTMGEDVYLGPGAKLFGNIRLGDRVRVGANAVVNKSFPDDVTLVGVPANVVKLNRERLGAHA